MHRAWMGVAVFLIALVAAPSAPAAPSTERDVRASALFLSIAEARYLTRARIRDDAERWGGLTTRKVGACRRVSAVQVFCPFRYEAYDRRRQNDYVCKGHMRVTAVSERKAFTKGFNQRFRYFSD